MTGYTVTHIGRSTRQDGPDWTPKERAMDEMKNDPERVWLTHEDHGASWSGSFRGFRASDLEHEGYPEYVRADIHAALTAERDALTARVKALETASGDMRERAAKACDEIESERWLMWKTYYDMMDQGRSDGACDCAAAIRALPLTGEAS